MSLTIPEFSTFVDPDRRIGQMRAERDTACRCARHVVQGLLDCPVGEVQYQAGMLHHHYPCLASMHQDPDYRDSLRHVSGQILCEAVREQIEEYLEPVAYFRPPGRVDIDDPGT